MDFKDKIIYDLTDEIYTLQEIAVKLKVSQLTLRRHIKSNKLKASKVGSEWRVTKDDLIKYIDNLLGGVSSYQVEETE